MVPCVIFEDEHMLVVHKPAGWNTHAPSPFAGEGIYEWLRHRERRWSSLAIIHRLDKETSGVLVLGKTTAANRSLTDQFAQRLVRKKYLLCTDHALPAKEWVVKTSLVRVGDKYASRAGGEIAETKFSPLPSAQFSVENPKFKLVCAEPFTGRTHQIRVHAAESGIQILGDTLYGGTPAARVFLHAAEIELAHPVTQVLMKWMAPVDFDADPRLALRTAVIEAGATDAFRLIHGATDGWPGWYVDKLGSFLLSQSEVPLTEAQREELARLAGRLGASGAYHKFLSRHVRGTTTTDVSPQRVLGEAAPERFEALENGIRYELSFREGYSVGLFLDQRDNRRRLLAGHVAANFELPLGNLGSQAPGEAGPGASLVTDGGCEVLNVFSYTCGFSVCAARAGARTTSLDLSKKYLEWGKRNFALNGLDSAAHDFIYGDAFDWLRRLAKKGRAFDIVVLDPPTFSQSKENGTFRVEKNFGDLVTAALPLLKPGSVLLASTNAADWPPEKFMAEVESAAHAAKRKIVSQHYVPQPPDFPINRAEPAYLKTVWLRMT
jgi:23S rRNA (cytosine1962-C5)-methyltransferase